jgi:hypothetical protein
MPTLHAIHVCPVPEKPEVIRRGQTSPAYTGMTHVGRLVDTGVRSGVVVVYDSGQDLCSLKDHLVLAYIIQPQGTLVRIRTESEDVHLVSPEVKAYRAERFSQTPA